MKEIIKYLFMYFLVWVNCMYTVVITSYNILGAYMIHLSCINRCEIVDLLMILGIFLNSELLNVMFSN